MALVTERLNSVGGVGFIEMIYDDTLAVDGWDGTPEDDILNCDLVSVRVVIEAGRTAKWSVRRGVSQNWKSGSTTGPIDETFTKGGPVKKVEDLTGFYFGGDE